MDTASVVLVPGLMCDRAVWRAQLEALAPSSLRIVVADHGEASSLQQMAQSVLDEIPGRLLAVGHSMGGRVVMEMARLQPQRLAGVALMDTGYLPLASGEAGRRERAGRMALLDLARREGVRAMAAQWVRNMVHPRRLQDRGLIDEILAMFARRSVAQFAAQQQALLDRPDASEVLRQLPGPTLLLCGEQDQWSPPSQHQAMQQLIVNSELTVVADSGHMLTMEQPDQVSAALTAWLNRCGVRTASGH